MDIGMKKTIGATYDEVLLRIPEALKSEGFGVLTEIDVKDTLKKKLDVDFRRYKIFGACNPALAHQALTANLHIGTMLPCNVVVYEDGEKRTVVLAVDPVQTIASADARIKPIADAVREKLSRVLEKLG